MALDVEQLQFVMVSARGAEKKMTWSDDWMYMGSMSSISLVSLWSEWLQVC